MTRAAAGPAAALLALTLWPAPGAGQALITQPQRYMLSTDVFDGRALWVQPAGMARRREASVGWSVTGESRDGKLMLEQYGLTLASSGFGIGWQRAELVDNSNASQWAIGYAGGTPRASVGLARRWLRGDRVHDAVWDAGARVVPRPGLELSVAWRDIGSVVVQSSDTAASSPDTTYSPTLLPAAALSLFGGRARLAAEAELLTSGWKRRAVRAGAAVALPWGLGVSARVAFDGDLAYQDVAIGITWSGVAARVTGFASLPESPGARHYGVWGSAVRDLEPAIPGFR